MLPPLACPVPLTLALSRPQLQHKVCFFNCSVRSFCWERQRIHLGAERMKEVLLLRALSAEAMKIKTPPEVSSPHSQHLPSFLYSSQDLKFILEKQKATCTSLWQSTDPGTDVDFSGRHPLQPPEWKVGFSRKMSAWEDGNMLGLCSCSYAAATAEDKAGSPNRTRLPRGKLRLAPVQPVSFRASGPS